MHFASLRLTATVIPAVLLILSVAAVSGDPVPESARVKIDAARRELQVAVATEARITADLERFRNTPEATAEALEVYETYLARVRAMVAAQRKLLEQMLAAAAVYGAAAGGSETTAGAAGSTPGVDDADDLARLDRQFEASLAAFDEMLLKEQAALAQKLEQIQARSDTEMTRLAEEAAAAAGRLPSQGRDQGQDKGRDGEEASETPASGESSGKGAEGSDAGPGGGAAGTPPAEGQQGRDAQEGGGKDGNKRPSPPPADDDDIVARQIREAAEKETDPELKEKLWQEYEDYKKGRRG